MAELSRAERLTRLAPPRSHWPVFYLEFDATLMPTHPEFRSVAGAAIGCWVDVPTAERADELARSAISAEEYVITRREQCSEVSRGEFADHPEVLARFDEAAAVGIALSYLRWPV
jgi:hypothetical protein